MPHTRVLFLVDSLAHGGLARVVVTLAERMSELGHVVGIGVLEPILEEMPSPAIWLKVQAQVRPAGSQAIFRQQTAAFGNTVIAEFEALIGPADLIIAAGELSLRCAPAWQHPRIVFSSHSSQLGSPKHPGWRGALRHRIKRWRRANRLRQLLEGRRVHLVSEGLAIELSEDLGVKPSSIDVIGNPFDIDAIRRSGHQLTPQALAQRQAFVIGVGAFNRRKRFDRLIRAFASSGLGGDLVLVGQGEEETHLRQLAMSLGIGERTHLIPFHENHYALVAKASVLALTSNSEGLPNVLTEALILGVPALSTDCPHGPRDILGELDPRALVPLDQLELLPERLRDIVHKPYPIPEQAVQRYALDTIVAQYLALADRLAAKD